MKPPSTTPTPAGRRSDSVREFKRGLIREAAKRIFAERGIADASVREIAKAAGYTTGAVYTYFATKEDLYAEVLRDSLVALHDRVAVAAGEAGSERSRAALRALWAFYSERGADFDLGFYLYGGARPVGLTPGLNGELNAMLDRVMGVIGAALVDDGLAAAADAHRRAVVAASSIFGLLLMAKTGRLRSLGEQEEPLLETCLATVTGSRS